MRSHFESDAPEAPATALPGDGPSHPDDVEGLDASDPDAAPRALHERVMALDLGERRIGVAVSDALGFAAHGRPTFQRTGDLAADLATLADRAREEEVRRVIVGLPLNMNGTEGPSALRTRAFVDALGGVLAPHGIVIELRDERLTSWEAERRLKDAGLDRRARAAEVDRVAAQIILQDWLDARR